MKASFRRFFLFFIPFLIRGVLSFRLPFNKCHQIQYAFATGGQDFISGGEPPVTGNSKYGTADSPSTVSLVVSSNTTGNETNQTQLFKDDLDKPFIGRDISFLEKLKNWWDLKTKNNSGLLVWLVPAILSQMIVLQTAVPFCIDRLSQYLQPAYVAISLTLLKNPNNLYPMQAALWSLVGIGIFFMIMDTYKLGSTWNALQPRDNESYAVVTGASSGLGKELARLFFAMGFNVVLVARRESKLKQLRRSLLGEYADFDGSVDDEGSSDISRHSEDGGASSKEGGTKAGGSSEGGNKSDKSREESAANKSGQGGGGPFEQFRRGNVQARDGFRECTDAVYAKDFFDDGSSEPDTNNDSDVKHGLQGAFYGSDRSADTNDTIAGNFASVSPVPNDPNPLQAETNSTLGEAVGNDELLSFTVTAPQDTTLTTDDAECETKGEEVGDGCNERDLYIRDLSMDRDNHSPAVLPQGTNRGGSVFSSFALPDWIVPSWKKLRGEKVSPSSPSSPRPQRRLPRVILVPCDLAAPRGAEKVVRRLEALGLLEKIDVLVNNAGVGRRESMLDSEEILPRAQPSTSSELPRFPPTEPDLLPREGSGVSPSRTREEDSEVTVAGNSEGIIELNIRASVRLTSLLVPHLARRVKRTGCGTRVLFVSSIAGAGPGPTTAVYTASKSFLNSFATSLRRELLSSGVLVTLALPGAITVSETDFAAASASSDALIFKLWGASMSAQQTAQKIVQGVKTGRDVVVPGLINKIYVYGVCKFLPPAAVGALAQLAWSPAPRLGWWPSGSRPQIPLAAPDWSTWRWWPFSASAPSSASKRTPLGRRLMPRLPRKWRFWSRDPSPYEFDEDDSLFRDFDDDGEFYTPAPDSDDWLEPHTPDAAEGDSMQGDGTEEGKRVEAGKSTSPPPPQASFKDEAPNPSNVPPVVINPKQKSKMWVSPLLPPMRLVMDVQSLELDFASALWRCHTQDTNFHSEDEDEGYGMFLASVAPLFLSSLMDSSVASAARTKDFRGLFEIPLSVAPSTIPSVVVTAVRPVSINNKQPKRISNIFSSVFSLALPHVKVWPFHIVNALRGILGL